MLKFRPIHSTIQIWTDFHKNEAKKKFFLKKKIQNGRFFKMAVFQNHQFSKISQPKNTKSAFFTCFCPYVRQPHDHIGWSICEIFAKILRIGDYEKRPFWKIGHFEFFSPKKFFFLLYSHENQSKFVWYNGWVEILTFSLVSR